MPCESPKSQQHSQSQSWHESSTAIPGHLAEAVFVVVVVVPTRCCTNKALQFSGKGQQASAAQAPHGRLGLIHSLLLF